MIIFSLLFLLILHYLAGSGLINLFGIELNRIKYISLSVICGIVLLSLVPFVLELFHIPITMTAVTIGMLLLCLLLNLGRIKHLGKASFSNFRFKLPSFRAYEIPFMILFSIFIIVSLWRSFYFPPNSRDMLSGPEVLAEYAVREHKIINSVFTVNLETTNNYQKPPFAMDLQIIYKYYGFVFGQIWVSILSLSFILFLFQVLRQRLHPLLACTLLLFFFAIPEVYAYSFIMLFDYPNMVLFFLGFYFLLHYFQSGKKNEFYFSAILFGFATYIRLETLVLIAMFVPALWFYALRNKLVIKHVALQTITMLAIPYFFYFIWVNVFMKYYMPITFDVTKQVSTHFTSLQPLFDRFYDMNDQLLFGRLSKPLWGHFFKVFIAMSVAEMVVLRKLSRESRNWWYAVLVVYFGLPLLGYLIPLVDLLNTTKRGLFKMLPFMLMVLANNGLLQKLSDAITRWENKLPEVITARRQNPKPVVKRTAGR
jgi:hypothetical protein